jgi:hypothetical protein
MRRTRVSDLYPVTPFSARDPDGLGAYICQTTGARFLDDRLRPIKSIEYPEANGLKVNCPRCGSFHSVSNGPAPWRHRTLKTWTEPCGSGWTMVHYKIPDLAR